MPEFITVQKQIERRTFLKGKFKGKFVGILDEKKSDLNNKNFYDLEILTGEVECTRENIRKWEDGDEFQEFQKVEKFLTKLPVPLPSSVKYDDGRISHFHIHLHSPKLVNYILSQQQYDQKKVFGVIEGEVSGFLRHYDTVDVQQEVFPEPAENEPILPNLGLITPKNIRGKNSITSQQPSKSFDNLKAQPNVSKKNLSFWNILGNILLVLCILLTLFIFIKFFWPFLILIGISILLNFIQPFFSFIGKWLVRFLSFGFVYLLLAGLPDLIKDFTIPPVPLPIDEEIEVAEVRPDKIGTDSIISHFRNWKDYNQIQYSGHFKIKVSEYRKATHNRVNMPYAMTSPKEYDQVVSVINNFDKDRLNLFYALYDSIKSSNHLSDKKFAEMIASSIQDIPYVLVLDQDCHSGFYNDAFISQYLNNGGDCIGNIKYGLLSPIEFIGSLKGDCDTRTLLLFTILDHYGYDVAMLSSEVYKHSIIGINLPYTGIAKIINGKRYFTWETTSTGFKPGMLSPEQAEMRFWTASLISKPKNL